jgi:hypothetical protein
LRGKFQIPKHQIPNKADGNRKFQTRMFENLRVGQVSNHCGACVVGERSRKYVWWRIGGLLVVAGLAGLNLARAYAEHDEGGAIGVTTVIFDDEMYGGRWNTLYVGEGPLDGDWVAATDHLEKVHSLVVNNELVTEDEIVRFLARHPELRDLRIRSVRITENGARQIGGCGALRTVRFGGRKRVAGATVDKLKTERPDLDIRGGPASEIIGCGPFRANTDDQAASGSTRRCDGDQSVVAGISHRPSKQFADRFAFFEHVTRTAGVVEERRCRVDSKVAIDHREDVFGTVRRFLRFGAVGVGGTNDLPHAVSAARE